MSTETGAVFSLAPGASLTAYFFFAQPGWQGLIYWVPHPLEVGQLGYSNEFIEGVEPNTWLFGKTVTNSGTATMVGDFEYTVL